MALRIERVRILPPTFLAIQTPIRGRATHRVTLPPRGAPRSAHTTGSWTGESYQQHLMLTFPNAAALKDPGKVFNAELGRKVCRAIDIRENDRHDGAAVRALIREVVACNRYHPPKLRR